MLMQLVTVAYYDVRPSRRTKPHYAEIYLFHAGGRYGDFSSFDVTPHREIFFPADPGVLIEAINYRAMTHLVVPDGIMKSSFFPWSEPEVARDRIRHCFAYDAAGQLREAEFQIISSDPAVRQDVELALDPMALAENIERYIDAGVADIQIFSRTLAQRVCSRVDEGSLDAKAVAKAHYEATRNAGVMRQTFRKISVDEALRLL